MANPQVESAGVDVAVLGTVRVVVRCGEGTVEVALSHLERCLMATLACSPGRAVSTERLIDALWDGAARCGGRTRVQGIVSSLRKRLAAAGGDPAILATDPSGYVLRVAPERVDAECFRGLMRDAASAGENGDIDAAVRAWRRGLELWRGPAFDGLRSFALRSEALFLEEMRMTALEHRINADLCAGRYAEVIPELTMLRARHPARERAVGQLMVALHATDRHAEALGAYRTLQRYLREEYGTAPGQRVRRIHQLLLLDPVGMAELLSALGAAGTPTG